MCCNGTLYTYVTVVPDDLPKLAKHPQLQLRQRSEQDTFDEPCTLHTGKGCSAYEDRPATCSRYQCELLRAVAADELTEVEAMLIIKEGRALVDNIKEYVAFEPGLPIAVTTWDAAPDGVDEDARRAWDRTIYHLGKHFLGTVREQVDPPQEPVPASGSAAFTELPEPPMPERPRSKRASSPEPRAQKEG